MILELFNTWSSHNKFAERDYLFYFRTTINSFPEAAQVAFCVNLLNYEILNYDRVICILIKPVLYRIDVYEDYFLFSRFFLGSLLNKPLDHL